jgi:hypothetical protein
VHVPVATEREWLKYLREHDQPHPDCIWLPEAIARLLKQKSQHPALQHAECTKVAKEAVAFVREKQRMLRAGGIELRRPYFGMTKTAGFRQRTTAATHRALLDNKKKGGKKKRATGVFIPLCAYGHLASVFLVEKGLTVEWDKSLKTLKNKKHGGDGGASSIRHKHWGCYVILRPKRGLTAPQRAFWDETFERLEASPPQSLASMEPKVWKAWEDRARVHDQP